MNYGFSCILLLWGHQSAVWAEGVSNVSVNIVAKRDQLNNIAFRALVWCVFSVLGINGIASFTTDCSINKNGLNEALRLQMKPEGNRFPVRKLLQFSFTFHSALSSVEHKTSLRCGLDKSTTILICNIETIFTRNVI